MTLNVFCRILFKIKKFKNNLARVKSYDRRRFRGKIKTTRETIKNKKKPHANNKKRIKIKLNERERERDVNKLNETNEKCFKRKTKKERFLAQILVAIDAAYHFRLFIFFSLGRLIFFT